MNEQDLTLDAEFEPADQTEVSPPTPDGLEVHENPHQENDPLPPDIRTALAENPEALESVESVFRQVGDLKPLAEVGTIFQGWQEALLNPTTQQQAIADMLAEIEQATGVKLTASSPTQESDLSRDLQEFKAWKKQHDADRADRAWQETHGSKVAKAIRDQTGGWEITPEMLAQARRQFPTIRNGLELAKRAFPDEYAAHVVRQKTAQESREESMPYMSDSITHRGQGFNPRSENLIGEFIRANGG